MCSTADQCGGGHAGRQPHTARYDGPVADIHHLSQDAYDRLQAEHERADDARAHRHRPQDPGGPGARRPLRERRLPRRQGGAGQDGGPHPPPRAALLENAEIVEATGSRHGGGRVDRGHRLRGRRRGRALPDRVDRGAARRPRGHVAGLAARRRAARPRGRRRGRSSRPRGAPSRSRSWPSRADCRCPTAARTAQRAPTPGAGRAAARPSTGRAGIAGAPTLLLLHGWTASSALNWFTTFPVLSRSFDVVAIDHRGHGRGIRSRRRFRLEDCADDAVALADVLGIDRFVPVGYSMGGPVAQLIWRRHPDRVERARALRHQPLLRGRSSGRAGGGPDARTGVARRPRHPRPAAPLARRAPARLLATTRPSSGRWAREEVRPQQPPHGRRGGPGAGHLLVA